MASLNKKIKCKASFIKMLDINKTVQWGRNSYKNVR